MLIRAATDGLKKPEFSRRNRSSLNRAIACSGATWRRLAGWNAAIQRACRWRAAVALYPGNGWGYLALVHCLLGQGDFESALGAIQKAQEVGRSRR